MKKVLEFLKTANLLWLVGTAASVGEAIRVDNMSWLIPAGVSFLFFIASSIYVSSNKSK